MKKQIYINHHVAKTLFALNSLAFIIILLISYDVGADCLKSYVCDGVNCGYVDVCQGSNDLPSINISPIQSPHLPGIKPLESIALPPLGATGCKYMLVNGHWQNICY